ncbi:oligosaccharide flippase family protein [Mobilicoccus sp.]|uniref:lipopolysaccharide biosynthesis protein n=1 Tax=Mobilicoccus sp. TaxID=2034349 RepID=UPI0028A0E89D|nr:oligosaccharide flippase family protein [Mobilicoccus sp.]
MTDHPTPAPDPKDDSGMEFTPSPKGPAPTRGSARTLVSGTSWSVVAQIIPLAINLGMTPYIISGLGGARYSIFLLISSITMLLSQFDGGIGQSALRYFTLYAGRDDREATTRLLFSVSAVIAAFGVLITVVVVVFSQPILTFFRLEDAFVREATVLLVCLTAVVGFLLLRNLYNAVVSARHQFGVLSVAVVAGHVVYAIGLVLTVENGWGLYGVAATMILQQVVGTLITVPVGLRYLTRAGMAFISRAEAADFARYAWKVQVAGIATVVTAQKDQLVAGRALSAQASGPFGQGSSFANQLKSVPLNAVAPIQALIGAEIGAVGAEASRAKVEKLQYLWVVFVTGWCAVGIPATLVGVRLWLPQEYALTGAVAAILLAGHFFTLVCTVSKTWAMTLGQAEVAMQQSLITLVSNVALSIALWFPFGIMGVVVGTSLGAAIGAMTLSFHVRRVVPTRVRWFMRDVPYWQAALCAALTFGIEAVCEPYLPGGVRGLALAGLLALPGSVVFVLITLGVRGSKEAYAMVRRG